MLLDDDHPRIKNDLVKVLLIIFATCIVVGSSLIAGILVYL